MRIKFTDKLLLLLRIFSRLACLPRNRKLIHRIVNPIDSVRYIEFAYLLKFLKILSFKPRKILDISSPYMLAYILCKDAQVIKTDINPLEEVTIRKNSNLYFKLEDATSLSFADDSFDMVYSISVIEHIYEKYQQAIQEMIRVLRPGGYLYLSFPVSCKHTEEWLDTDIYARQYREDGKTFFQYRFSEDDVKVMVAVAAGVELIDMSVFWEKHDGLYDRIVKASKKPSIFASLTSLRDGFDNLWYGFNLTDSSPADFSCSKSFGNASLLLRKMGHSSSVLPFRP